MVAQLEDIDEAEAATMVRDAVRSLKTMHGFMLLAGVVRERVVCHECPDGRLQLDDLKEDCWNILRGYLKLEDIRDPTTEASAQ